MSYLLYSLFIILVLIKFCLTHELNELNICDTQTQITVKHAFRYQNKFVVFVKLNRSETVYVIKVNVFDPLVSDNDFESRSSSVELWLGWDMNVNDGRIYMELENFEDVFVREDPFIHYVVYLKSGHYYIAQYDTLFSRVVGILDKQIANSSDTLQIEIARLFKERNDRYLTSMRFPEANDSPKKALVYSKTQSVNVFNYNVNVLTLKQVIRRNGNEEWVTVSERIPYDTNIVSAFYITNYTSVETNRKQFYMIEISLNGGFKVKKITLSTQMSTNDTTKEDISDVYSGDMRQLFQCPVMPTTLSSTTTTTDLSIGTSITPSTANTVSSSHISSISSQETTVNNTGKELNELNICSPETQITVENAFWHTFRYHLLSKHFAAFVKINSSDTVYAIKLKGFEPSVSDNGLELTANNNSAQLWKEWNVEKNGTIHHELEHFEDVFLFFEGEVPYVIYVYGRSYFKAYYDNSFNRIWAYLDRQIPSGKDTLLIAIDGRFSISGEYSTSMRFKSDYNIPQRAFVYLKRSFDNLLVFTQITGRNGLEDWVRGPTFYEDPEVVSAFLITGYTRVDANYKQFYMMEISKNGGFKVKRIEDSIDRINMTVVDRGDIKQLLQCPDMSTLSSTTTTEMMTTTTTDTSRTLSTASSLSPFEISSTISIRPSVEITISETTDMSTHFSSGMTSDLFASETSPNKLSTIMSTITAAKQKNNNMWIYIIIAIILLLILVAVILLIWCCCCRTKKSEIEENENVMQSKSIPEEEKTIRSDIIESSDTGNQSQSDSADNPSDSVSQQTETPKDENAS